MEKTEDSTNDFNMIMDKKFDEYKTYIIKLKQMGIQDILKGYKDQLEKVTATAEILQQH